MFTSDRRPVGSNIFLQILEPLISLLTAEDTPNHETSDVLQRLFLVSCQLENIVVLDLGDGGGAFLGELICYRRQLLADFQPALHDLVLAILVHDGLLESYKVVFGFCIGGREFGPIWPVEQSPWHFGLFAISFSVAI